MRIRTIKPDFFSDEKLGELPAICRIAFIGLWCAADREGRMEDRPRKLQALITPYDACDMSAMLDDLAKAEIITRYEVDGENYIQINNFGKHQKPNHKEQPSIIPPPRDHGVTTAQPRRDHGVTTACPRVDNNGNPPRGEIEIEIEIEGKGNITPPTPPEGVVVAAQIIAAENSVDQKTSSCARQELAMSGEYQSVLEAWKDCTTATGQALIKDENTRAGAEMLADMLQRGDCSLDQIKTAMANARGDPETRRKYGLRGIARNLGNLQEARNGAATGRRGAVTEAEVPQAIADKYAKLEGR